MRLGSDLAAFHWMSATLKLCGPHTMVHPTASGSCLQAMLPCIGCFLGLSCPPISSDGWRGPNGRKTRLSVALNLPNAVPSVMVPRIPSHTSVLLLLITVILLLF